MGPIECATCGYDLSAHTGQYRPGVLCPECGDADAARARFERSAVGNSLPRSMRPMLWAGILGVVGLISVSFPEKPATNGGAYFYGWVMIVASGWLCVREYFKRRRSRTKAKG